MNAGWMDAHPWHDFGKVNAFTWLDEVKGSLRLKDIWGNLLRLRERLAKWVDLTNYYFLCTIRATCIKHIGSTVQSPASVVATYGLALPCLYNARKIALLFTMPGKFEQKPGKVYTSFLLYLLLNLQLLMV